MSNTAPQNHRPETLEDHRHRFVFDDRTVCDPPAVMNNDIARWWGNALAAAADVPGFEISESGSIVCPRTDEEKQEKLEAEQAAYDRGRDCYQTFLDTGERPKTIYAWSAYLDYEGINVPKEEDNDE